MDDHLNLDDFSYFAITNNAAMNSHAHIFHIHGVIYLQLIFQLIIYYSRIIGIYIYKGLIS